MGANRTAGIWLLCVLFNSQSILQVPYVKQENYYCAASCLAMVRLYWGEDATQYEIAEQAGWAEKRGITIQNLIKYLDNLSDYRYQIGNGQIDQLKEWLGSGYPIIVALKGTASDIKHAVVLIGFDKVGFYYHDPSQGEKMKTPYAKFISDWASSDCLFCILVPTKSGVNLEINSNPNTGL